ncbi:death domain-containing protein 1 isoform X1 [Pelobates fuscus]|uniref:death domain-containing protein 1 isoform X1 n=1 Tax=Pelobates fuscus TaxID=191477 RepID=UPI002FE43535
MLSMELASTDFTNTEDRLIQILTHIKQYNENVKDLLEGSHLKNNEDLEKCIFSLILLIHDLSKTFCDKISRTTESLQSTFHLLKGIQNKFKDFGSNNEDTHYLTSISQILSDTAQHLKLAEEQLNMVSTQYSTNQTEKSNVTRYETKEDFVDGSTVGKAITDTSQYHKASEKINLEEAGKCNEQCDEGVSAVTVMNVSPFIKTHSISPEDEYHQDLNFIGNTDIISGNEEHLQPLTEQIVNDKQQLNNIKQQNDSDSADSDKENRIELHVNSTEPNLSKQPMIESKHWTYKQYMLKSDYDKEQRLACFIKAPPLILEQIECRLMDDISSLVVSDSEELVSSVLGIWSKDANLKIPFPLSVSIPFNSRYRGNYKDVMVKANDENLQASYLTPNLLDGYHGNHKQGSFAEVKVYKLGIFAVVSCLRKENFTVFRKGLSIKLSMDSRISLNYPSGCFNTSVIVQFKVQPIDTSLISQLKVKHDIYHSVVSSSPLVHVKQPSFQAFHKPVTVILPCPPNPEKKKQGEDIENKRASTATVPRVTSSHQIRAVSASVKKHGDNPTELLKLLAFKEDQWAVLDDVVVKNVQNGIVSFEVSEHLQSFIVIRLSSAMDNAHLLSFIQNLQDVTYSSMVNVILYRKKDNPQKAVFQVVSSKELNWEVLNLREAGYIGPPEPSEQIPLQEGEQIYLRFCGNIAASDGKTMANTFKLTFHCQRKQQLPLNLSVVDEFGNHSSQHYKGTVAIYKLSKEDIIESYKSSVTSDVLLQQRTPVSKLALTLPKMEKNVIRPSSTKLSSSDPTDVQWDNLLHWLAQELTEEDASLLVLSLPIRRSTIQLVKLKSPDNLTEQIYELLTFWKKSLPTSADKLRLLARHLRKSGRSNLVEALQTKWETNTFYQKPL